MLYAALLIALSVVCTTALANSRVYRLLTEFTSSMELKEVVANPTPPLSKSILKNTEHAKKEATVSTAAVATIIQGADEEVGCSDNGFTVARFNLCGDFDDRTVTLSGNLNVLFQWQQFNPSGSCTFDVNDDCPNTTNTCWSTVSTASTFNIDASSIPASVGAEYRVRVNGGAFYYFKVKKSTINQQYVKTDYICSKPGRIQITNISASYEFSMNSGSGFGPWQDSPVFGGLMPGTYIVKTRLKDTPNTCQYLYEPIVIEQRDIAIDVTFTDAHCINEFGSITVTPRNVPGPYKYTLLDENGVAQEFTTFIATSPYTFNAVGFGTYSVQVETQQCKGDPANGIDPPRQDYDTGGNPIIIGEGIVALAASTEVNNSFGCNVTDVDITVRTSGGVPPYTFIVNGTGPSSPAYNDETTYNVTAPGTYDFLITDSNGCTISASANVEELTPPNVTVSGIDGTCTNGGAKLNFNVIDAKGYNLSFRATPADTWSPNPLLTVPAGTYNNIQVRYEQGSFNCIYDIPASITVSTIGTISGSAVKIADRTCNGSGGVDGGSIEFQGPFSGGSGSGYVFSISGDDPSNFSTQTSYTNLAPGTYTPIIRDNGGCRLELTPITIADVDPPTDIDFSQSNINCGTGTTDVQLAVTANAAIAQYVVISPTPGFDNDGDSTNNIITGLSTNTSYVFQVTDVNGCSYTESFTPAVISSIRVRIKSGGDFKVCSGATDGTGTFIVDGFANNYTYNIDGGPESAPQSDTEVVLPPSGAGTYVITVTDADTGCTDMTSITINAPSTTLSLTGNVTAMSCQNGNTGRVVANASGGWGSNRYTLDYPDGSTSVGPKSGRTFGNLTQSGTYLLTVTDAEGCTDTFTFDLTPLSAPTISLDSGASSFCYVPGTGATLVVSSTAGTAPLASHQYRINGGTLQGSPIFMGLAPGNYAIEVVDGNNCSDIVNVTINPRLRVTSSIESEIPCGGLPGQLRVRVSGGYITGPGGSKQFEVSSDNGTSFSAPQPLVSNNFLYDTATPGTYIFRITDNRGCVAESNPLVLSPPMAINATTDVIDASCGQTDNGIITIIPDATIGVPPYEISFDGGAFSSQTTYSNLNAGQVYNYTVRDARGCLFTGSETIGTNTNPAPDATVVPVDATCNSNVVSGEIQITNVTGGTPDFTYILHDQFGAEIARIGPTSSTSETFTGLAPGTYTVVTVDRSGCRDEDTVTVDQTTVTVVPDPITPVSCSATGFTNTVTIVGGVGPFEIRLVEVPANLFVSPNPGPRRHTFTGLQYGVSYTVEVKDLSTGCIYEDVIDPVDGLSPLDVTATSTAGFCDASRNGEIVYTVSGFTLGDNLQIELVDNSDGSRTVIETVTPGSDPYANNYLALPGDYQIIVTNLTDDCTAATGVIIAQNLPSIDILAERAANCNANGSVTVQGSGGAGGPYFYAFVPQGTPPDDDGTATPADPSDDFGTETTFFAPSGNYDIYVRDASGCTSFDIATVIQLDPVLPSPSINVVNQCVVTATSFQIDVSMPNTVNTPRFTLGGNTQIGVLNGSAYEATFFVNSPGSYPVDVVDANGCTSQGVADVYEFLSVSGAFTTMPTCFNPDGEITVQVVGGSNSYSYQLQGEFGGNIGAPIIGDRNAGVFSGIATGNYRVYIEDTETLCNDTVIITLDPPVSPLISNVIAHDISCNGDNDGSIDVVLQTGTDVDFPIEYTLYDTGTSNIVQQNSSGSFIGLSPGFYDVVVSTERNCEDRRDNVEISEPQPFAITASAPDFACEPGANRYSSTVITVVDPSTTATPGTPGYQYSITGFENYQSSNTFEIVDTGSPQDITIYAIDGNGCQDTFDLPTLNPPTDVVPTLSVLSALNCQDPERVRIDVTGTTDFTVTTSSVVPVAAVGSGGNSFVEINLPASGDYLFEVTDNTGGCTYPLPKYTVEEPVAPTVVINEAKPIQCFGTDDGELFIEVANYSGTYDYQVYSVDNAGVQTATPISGSFDTNNYPDTNGDPARITGVPGGNFVVRVTSTQDPFCSNQSNLATIRTPNGPLDVTATEIGNVSCNDNAGKIEATATGGWDVAPYEYRLLKDDGTGTYVEEVPFSGNNEFENLSSGNYRVEVTDIEGCTHQFDIPLNPIPPIQAGIREPQGLICPDGNNAVLEAYDPTTGDAITASPGATGGVPGAGYKYQLLYLNSNDNTDINSRSGLQDLPTFAGNAGAGFISEGWYAIEVSSGFGCVGVTLPYYVDPPPPIDPKLVQLRAPGCGGQGEMQLSIENPEPGFTYEYRPVGVPDTDPFIPIIGTSVIINGTPGFYQYDVRKVGGSNTCGSISSEGISLVDAQDLDLMVNLPDDISCASENDGRIESFSTGGVGDNSYILFDGDPGNPFSPNAGATIIQGPQEEGIFEGLSEGTEYYVAVTSGVTCWDVEGPYEIVRPDPIVVNTIETPVSCNGQEDGSISIEVQSGGVGLVQFAISPNFNEFFSDPATPGQYVFDELEAGTYEILVQDENGCSEKRTLTIMEPEPLMATSMETPETCIGTADGTAQLTITGGTPFVAPDGTSYYETSLNSSDDADFARNDSLLFENLQGGETYVIFIRDASGCQANIIAPITIGVDLTAEPIVAYGCDGIFPNSTVTVQMKDNSLLPKLLFALDVNDILQANTQRTFGDLPPGDHTVYIYHENGCTSFVEFTIDPYDPLTLEAVKTGFNEITATASGGFGGYEYFFQGTSTGQDNIYHTNEDGNVTIKVVDLKGCEATVTIPFDFDGMLTLPKYFTPDGDNNNDLWYPRNRDFFPNLEVKIYDRYGRVVAVLDQVSGWDGTYDGKEVPTGDYWYVVNANDKDKQQYVGHFTLYR